MRKKTVPLISHFCSRKQNAASTDIVYHQALYKGRSVLEPFDLTGYGSVKLPCLVSYNVPSYREHGSHCIYIAETYFEQLSIFEGEWVCVVTGDRDTNHIVSCHVASAQLFHRKSHPKKPHSILAEKMPVLQANAVTYQANSVFCCQMGVA